MEVRDVRIMNGLTRSIRSNRMENYKHTLYRRDLCFNHIVYQWFPLCAKLQISRHRRLWCVWSGLCRTQGATKDLINPLVWCLLGSLLVSNTHHLIECSAKLHKFSPVTNMFYIHYALIPSSNFSHSMPLTCSTPHAYKLRLIYLSEFIFTRIKCLAGRDEPPNYDTAHIRHTFRSVCLFPKTLSFQCAFKYLTHFAHTTP